MHGWRLRRRTVVSRLWWRWIASEFGIGGADPMLRVEAAQRGRRRRSARRRQARKRRVPGPSSGRRTSNRGSRRRRDVCRAPQRARLCSQGRARREPPTRRGRAEACGDRPLPSTWVDDASRCSAGQRAIASSADADARGQLDMPLRGRVDGVRPGGSLTIPPRWRSRLPSRGRLEGQPLIRSRPGVLGGCGSPRPRARSSGASGSPSGPDLLQRGPRRLHPAAPREA
jgi:hypothetical protein